MAGDSMHPKSGLIVDGGKGRYELGDSIGRGGNGEVFVANVIEGKGVPQSMSGYAIKIFDITSKEKNEYKKRQSRFIKEIESVLSFQDKVRDIIPIYDTSLFCDKDQEPLWYLMPRASAFRYQNCKFSQKLEYMLRVGESIKQLHNLGYAHRDIKPNNLLFFEGQVYLADFGLIWNAEEKDEHITEVNDHLGPAAIRPPELQHIGNIDRIDYRKSDVYLFAKTLWMIVQCNNRGFLSEYLRTDDYVYINKADFQLETVEPLHCLMEEATRSNWGERIDLDTCIFYLTEQIRIIQNDIPQERLKAYKYAEQAKLIIAKVPPDKMEYTDPTAIVRILNGMSGAVCLVFVEFGTESGRLPLIKANQIQGSIFEVEIQNPYNYEKRKTIELAIESVCSKTGEELEFEIQSNAYSFDDNLTQEYTQIIKALESTEKRVRLNARYLIKLVH